LEEKNIGARFPLLILKSGKGMEGLKRFTVWFWDLNRREARQERLHAFHVGEGRWPGGEKGHGTIL
jgi:hypothetical protein